MPTDPNYIHADVPHERTVEKPGTKWGCYNTKREPHYFAPNRSYVAGGAAPYVEHQVKIDDTLSVVCVTKKFHPNDPKCVGCEK